jgi:hypothetical protein
MAGEMFPDDTDDDGFSMMAILLLLQMVNSHWSKITGVGAFQDVASAYATSFPIRASLAR